MLSGSGFWSGYWQSLKHLDVEEPIDVWVHRPLAYVLARGLLPTPVSANAVTLGAIVLGIAAGVALFWPFRGHMQVAGLCIFLSAVFDCADGQLARMRGTSSRFGRMLDGSADLIVTVAVVSGATWVVWKEYADPLWLGLAALGVVALGVATAAWHTALYDHYKNVLLRMMSDHQGEGEGLRSAEERYRQRPESERDAVSTLVWRAYLFYLKSQREIVGKFDPYTVTEPDRLPPWTAEQAVLYRKYNLRLMRVWRGWFGFGALMFGLAVAAAVDVLDWYVMARVLVQNGVYFGYLRPAQRRASKQAFEALGLLPAPR